MEVLVGFILTYLYVTLNNQKYKLTPIKASICKSGNFWFRLLSRGAVCLMVSIDWNRNLYYLLNILIFFLYNYGLFLNIPQSQSCFQILGKRAY